MTSIRLLVESEIRRCVRLDLDAVAVVRDAFTRLANGEAVTPPVMRVDIAEHHGEVDVKTAYIRGRDSFAIKIASGFFENYRLEDVEGAGTFENYPNRNSVQYREIYGLKDASTVYRGTYRMTGWCETLRKMVALGWLNDQPLSGFSIARLGTDLDNPRTHESAANYTSLLNSHSSHPFRVVLRNPLRSSIVLPD